LEIINDQLSIINEQWSLKDKQYKTVKYQRAIISEIFSSKTIVIFTLIIDHSSVLIGSSSQ